MTHLLKKKIMSSLVIGLFTVSLGSVVFASPDSTSLPPGPPPSNGGPCPFCGRPGLDFYKQADTALTELVSKGTITAEQKNQILTFFHEKDQERQAARTAREKKFHDQLLQDLSQAGQLTVDQAQAVDTALRSTLPPLPPLPPRGDEPPAPLPPV